MLVENDYEVCFLTEIMLFQDIILAYNVFYKEREDLLSFRQKYKKKCVWKFYYI